MPALRLLFRWPSGAQFWRWLPRHPSRERRPHRRASWGRCTARRVSHRPCRRTGTSTRTASPSYAVRQDGCSVDTSWSATSTTGATRRAPARPSSRSARAAAAARSPHLPRALPGRCPGGVGLTTALGVLRSGWVVVGSLPTSDGTAATAKAGCLIVLDSHGRVRETLRGNGINGPWDMTIAPGRRQVAAVRDQRPQRDGRRSRRRGPPRHRRARHPAAARQPSPSARRHHRGRQRLRREDRPGRPRRRTDRSRPGRGTGRCTSRTR